jgi:hypothetical protein
MAQAEGSSAAAAGAFFATAWMGGECPSPLCWRRRQLEPGEQR